MFELPKVAIFTVLRDENLRPHEPFHIFCEVVLLDKTLSPTHPLLYQLHVQAVSQQVSFHQHAELIAGEVSYIDRQQREIVLSDTSTIRYKHLIVINGENEIGYSTEKSNALTLGLSALNGQLKFRDHMDEILNALLYQKSKTQTKAPLSQIEKKPSKDEDLKLLESLLEISNAVKAGSITRKHLQPRHLLEVLP